MHGTALEKTTLPRKLWDIEGLCYLVYGKTGPWRTQSKKDLCTETSLQRTHSLKELSAERPVQEGQILWRKHETSWTELASKWERWPQNLPWKPRQNREVKVWHFAHWVSIGTEWQYYTVPGAQSVNSTVAPTNVEFLSIRSVSFILFLYPCSQLECEDSDLSICWNHLLVLRFKFAFWQPHAGCALVSMKF